MTGPRGKRGQQSAINPKAAVDYNVVRDRFLVSSERNDGPEWLVRVGKYVQHCWEIEAEAYEKSGDTTFDDRKFLGEWDKVREEEIITLQATAEKELHDYVLKNFPRMWFKYKKRHTAVRWFVFFLVKSRDAFVGAIGLTIIVMAISATAHWLNPVLAQRALSFVQSVVLPEDSAKAIATTETIQSQQRLESKPTDPQH